MDTQVIFLAFVGVALIVFGFLLWQKNKKKTGKEAPQGGQISSRQMATLEKDYYRLYTECSNCGYVCGIYIKRGISLEETLCPNCCVRGKIKPAHYKEYKGVDIVIPELPKEPEEVERPQILKGSGKSRMWR